MSKTHQRLLGGMRRNIQRLASGAIVSQILMVASTPLFTRIFNPESFGVLATFTAAYAIAIPIITLKYDAAVILPKAVSSAISLTALVAFISSAIVIVVGGLAVVAIQMSLLPEKHEINLLLPLALWLGAFYTLTQVWSARNSDYKHFARSQVIGTALNICTSLTLGMLYGGQTRHLVLGFVCGIVGSLLYMLLSQTKKINYRFTVSVKRLLRRAYIYRQFPLLVLPSTLLMALGPNSVPLILSANYPLGDVGQFAIANRILLVPAALIGGAVAESFRSELVRRQRERLDAISLFNKTLSTLVILALPMFSVLFVSAPFVFSVAFGSQYEEAGYLTRATLMGVVAQFIAIPFACVFVALRQTAIGLRVHIAITIVPLSLLWGSAALQLPITTSLGIYSVATLVCMIMMLVIAKRLCHASDGMIKTKSP